VPKGELIRSSRRKEEAETNIFLKQTK